MEEANFSILGIVQLKEYLGFQVLTPVRTRCAGLLVFACMRLVLPPVIVRFPGQDPAVPTTVRTDFSLHR